MLSGIGMGLLSGVKNKKIVTVVGAVLAAIGIGGMIYVGSQAANILSTRGAFESPDVARSYFYGEYAFLFVMVAGLVLAIYGAVSMQRQKAKERARKSQ